MIQGTIEFKLAERAKKYISIRGKGSAMLSVTRHMHQGPGSVKITLEPIAKVGKPSEEEMNEYRLQVLDGIDLYVHKTVDEYAESNEVIIAYEDGFYYSGLVMKGLIKNALR